MLSNYTRCINGDNGADFWKGHAGYEIAPATFDGKVIISEKGSFYPTPKVGDVSLNDDVTFSRKTPPKELDYVDSYRPFQTSENFILSGKYTKKGEGKDLVVWCDIDKGDLKTVLYISKSDDCKTGIIVDVYDKMMFGRYISRHFNMEAMNTIKNNWNMNYRPFSFSFS